ncbi:type II toxin-antitoxin system RelE/ParE family toxin [Streptomyces murinus]|uniref:type II toxin-antitoxin system RelE/ParE family toxin n=1 Tax=Streptomyces murinus TaxID=33900 RepID=UPI0023787A7B|nr:type II toxin-antitoxin system RelE/ParE family toxin [Streptomyces murinus]WDO08794.1 type II toxin-antitoxin system RelE/ParE family toxin [Streptomyces murinus]
MTSCGLYVPCLSWEIILTPEVHEWFLGLDDAGASLVRDAVELLADQGPTLGRPAVDRIHGSQLHNLKELRPGSSGRSEIRILFLFDVRRQAVLLMAGDKAGNWDGWYRDAIKLAEERYERYLETPSEEIE